MEKDYRLFVRNLPINIDESKVEKLLKKYVTVKKIDLKEKKDIDEKVNKFAFVNVTASHTSLSTCFSQLNGERIQGFEISVELAKESFLERLKRERTENNENKEKSNIPANTQFKIPDSLNGFSTSKAKHKTFLDNDLESNDIEFKELDKTNNVEDCEHEKTYTSKTSNYENCKRRNLKKSNDFKERNDFELDVDVIKTNKEVKTKKLESTKAKNLINNDRVGKLEISESQRKRLMSLQQKKQAFKLQEQTIRDALRSVDNKKLNNKIVFDDNMDFENLKEINTSNTNKKNALFDSEDEDQEEFQWNEDEFSAKAKVKDKLLKMQTNIGNDKRFVLDERFVDNEDKVEEKSEKNTDEAELDEKKWQLNILGDVLGKPISTPNADNSDMSKKKNRMIRYDPTASNHEDFELTIQKTKQEKPKKKKKKLSISENKDEAFIPISKDLFYDVSEKLVESLQKSEEFSLLQSLGRDIPNNDDNKNKLESGVAENGSSFKFDFSAKNPFKYDSSDDEGRNEVENENNNQNLYKSEIIKYQQKNDKLFFVENDDCFQEAKNFFKNQSVYEENEFRNKRRELKAIVRSKIRNNLRNTVPWNRKKVRKIQKREKF